MRIHTASYDDWKQVFVNGDLHFEGHSVPDFVWEELLGSLKVSDIPITVEPNIDFSNYGPYFAYRTAPRNEYELHRVFKFIQEMEKQDYTLDEEGNWVRE